MQKDKNTNTDQDLAQSVEDARVSLDGLQQKAEHADKGRSKSNSSQLSLLTVFLLLWAAILWYQGAMIINPYAGIDPLADREIAENYLYDLIDELEAWKIENGNYPDSLEEALQLYQLPSSNSQYSISYLNFAASVDLELIGPGAYEVRVSSSSEE